MLYRTIYADPPWHEQGGGKVKRGADRHYPLIRHPIDIADAMKNSGKWNIADAAHLYMWTTDNHLTDALEVIRLLRFRYVRTFVWVKVKEEGSTELRQGIGQYARGCHELLLFAVRGEGMSPDVLTEAKDVPSAMLLPHVMRRDKGSKMREHSSKPDEWRMLIEYRSKGPYLEMFARERSEGWDVFGNEVDQ